MARKSVSINALGLCEHCGALLNMQDIPTEGMNAEWRCPRCEEALTGVSFGFEGNMQVRWVGPEGKWVQTRPSKDFQLGELDVRTEQLELHLA